VHRAPGQRNRLRDGAVLANKKRVIKMLLIVVTLFTLSWLPYQTYFMAALMTPSINQFKYINLLFLLSHWLAMSNSCVNPFIYSIYSSKFRTEFKQRLSLRRRRVRVEAEDRELRAMLTLTTQLSSPDTIVV